MFYFVFPKSHSLTLKIIILTCPNRNVLKLYYDNWEANIPVNIKLCNQN